ncbi:MAG: hypothetical protein IPJ30_27300 [Acidobacteria bacterium]|nr:hypothetical protein [Acidobacteriota bacterium]
MRPLSQLRCREAPVCVVLDRVADVLVAERFDARPFAFERGFNPFRRVDVAPSPPALVSWMTIDVAFCEYVGKAMNRMRRKAAKNTSSPDAVQQ